MRTIVLAVLAAVVVALALLVEAPERREGALAVSGPRLVRVPRGAVRRLTIALGDAQLVAERDGAGWRVDGVAAPERVVNALNDFVTTLVTLRAVDAFRSEPQQAFGLTPPKATLTIESPRRTVRVEIGAYTATTATVYARRAGDPRVFQIGSHLVDQVRWLLDRRPSAP